MSLFGEQIQSRIAKDRARVLDSLLQVADSVDGKARFHPKESKSDNIRNEVTRICHYFELEPLEEVPTANNVNDLIDYLVRPLGIMRRRIVLEDRWWKNGDGPLLAVEKETGKMCALLPDKLYGYRYFDSSANAFVKVNTSNKDRFETDAVCFYRPLPLKPMSGRNLIVFLMRHTLKNDSLLIRTAMLLITVVGILTPLITQVIFAQIIPSGKSILLALAVALLICAALGNYLFTTVKTAIMSRIVNHMDTLLQNSLMGRLLSLPVKFFSDKSAGGLAQSIDAMAQLPTIIANVYYGTWIMVVMSLLYIFQVLLMAPALSLPALLTFVLEIAMIGLCMKQKAVLIRDQLEADKSAQGLVFALISGIQKIKLSGSENRAFAKWAELYQKKSSASYQMPFPAFMQNEMFVAIQLIGMMIAYISAAGAGVSVANFAAFSSSFGMVVAALMQLSASTDMITYLKPVLDMGETILKAVPEVSSGKKIVEKLNGSIELSNVSFQYEKDGPKIIDNISLSIESGEYVAIVGKSGCGKSTLMRLLLGFEDPDEGAIYYGKHDLSTLDLASFRRNIGTVLQSGKLFAGDVFSNITISAPWLKMDDAWEAARMAGMADDIEDMPMGMHTLISEGSGGISGGQRQRLMIARAIAPKPSILMFDEATSALDNITQKIVTDSLSSLKCTRIVIAHRLSTIKDCDRIIVLDSGKIVEDGTYDELIAKRGFFADLVSRQQVEASA